MNSFWKSLAVTFFVCAIFYALSASIAKPWINMATNQNLNEVLMASLESYKQLASLDPENKDVYLKQFEETKDVLAHLEVLQANRSSLLLKFRLAFLGLFLIAGSGFLIFHLWHNRRMERGIEQIRLQLSDILLGQSLRETPKDMPLIFQRVANLILETSQEVEEQKQKLRDLEHIKSWQDGTRRIAHEVKTPITTMQQALAKWRPQLAKFPEIQKKWEPFERNFSEELDGLRDFAHGLSEFAKLREPKLQNTELNRFLREFCELYWDTWPGLKVTHQTKDEPLFVDCDRTQIRQVLVNLIQNAFSALDGQESRIELAIENSDYGPGIRVKDEGPGIDPQLRNQMFLPYVSSHRTGQNMGLGLAISKKILLAHQGDLICTETSDTGTTFLLYFPKGGTT